MDIVIPGSGSIFRLVLLCCALVSAPLVAQESSSSSRQPQLPEMSAVLPDAPSAVASAAMPSGELRFAEFAQSSSSAPPAAQNPQQPNAPSLGDLGLTPEQTQGNAQQQALLDRRTHMLKVHQRLGLLTLIPMAAAYISSAGATADHGPSTTGSGNTAGRDLHAAIGSVTVGMYAATAYYAIRAPKVSHEPSRGGIKFHKYLIYVHAPGMVLTPILGAMAFDQLNKGEKVHGIASAHGAVATVTTVSYAAAILAVSWPIRF